MDAEVERLKAAKARPADVNPKLEEFGSTPIQDGSTLLTLLRRPEITYDWVEQVSPSEVELTADMKEQVEIQIKYAGYIEKQLIHVERLQKMEKKKIPDTIEYNDVHGLAMEAKQNYP